jgi:hypothetical protein
MTHATPTNLRSSSTRRFWRHYAEMVVVMFMGMFALSMPADALFGALGMSTSDHHPATMLFSMGITMTVPMVAWMRYRGHAWRPNIEMAASMIVPTLGAMALASSGVLTAIGTLMIIEHVAMLSSMMFVMLIRRDEYACEGHALDAAQQAMVA